jgi:uridine phosphorylase
MTRQFTFPTNPSCHLEIDKASPYVLTGGSAGRIDRMRQYLDHPESVEFVSGDRKHSVIYGTYKGLQVMAASTGMGPSSVSIILPEIIEASSDPNLVILRLGTCGGIRAYENVGDLIISRGRIFRHENTSSLITMNPFYIARPDEDVAAALEIAANNNKQDFQTVYSGNTTTVSELYFTNMVYRRLLSNPVTRTLLYLIEPSLAISMEGSVYCALRKRYKGLKVGEIFTVSDIVAPKDMEANDRTQFEQGKDKIEQGQILTGLETLLAMSKKA